MRIKVSEWITLLQVPADFFSVLLAFSLAFFLKTNGFIGGLEYVPGFDQYWPFVFVIACLQVIVFFSLRVYALDGRTFLRELGMFLYGLLLWSGLVFALLFLEQQFYFSRLLLAAALIIFFLLAFTCRSILRLVRRILYRLDIGFRNVILVGSGDQVMHIAQEIEELPGWKLLGIIEEKDLSNLSLEEVFAQWEAANSQRKIDEVWNVSDQLSPALAEEIFDFSADRRIVYRYLPSSYASSSRSTEAMFIGDYPLIEVLATPLRGWGKVAKRIVDIVGSILGLIILSPLFLVVAILNKIFAPGPVFIGLKRVGTKTYKSEFVMYKFRSMIVGAHAMKPQLLALNERKGGPLFKLKNDPRITPIGKYLRKLRIDELPQLWNVLKGQMSLVGPRAHEPEEIAKYTPKQLRLLRVKPGMTGMGQVSGSADLSFDEEVKLETYYIQNWSLWLDMQVLLRTIWAVINRKGAA